MKPQKLKGFRDYLPAEALLRQTIISDMQEIAKCHGFQPIQTPTIEYAETLLGEGGETDKQVYRWQDTGEREVALRYDLTVPFARFAAENLAALPIPFKRLEIGQVFRAEKPQKGRFREFSQCDLDIIGTRNISADIEVISTLAKVLAKVNFGSFTFSLNHRAVLSGLIRHFLGEEGQKLEAQVLIALDKLEKIGAEGVNKIILSFVDGTQIGEAQVSAFTHFLVSAKADFEAGLGVMSAEMFKDDKEALQGLSELREIFQILKAMAISSNAHFGLDFSIARGLAYYTGIVFECTMDANPSIGSICSGGRYDNLAGRFTREPLPGVGGSLGLDRLVAGLNIEEQTDSAISDKIFIILPQEAQREAVFILAQQLRGRGLNVDVFMGTSYKVANQLRFASRMGFKHVIILGEDEVRNNVYTYKQMQENIESKNLTFDELLGKIQ